jgi:hypothetical protein
MLRKQLLISEELQEKIRGFRFAYKFDTEMDAIRTLLSVGLSVYEERENDVRHTGGATGSLQSGEEAHRGEEATSA